MPLSLTADPALCPMSSQMPLSLSCPHPLSCSEKCLCLWSAPTLCPVQRNVSVSAPTLCPVQRNVSVYDSALCTVLRSVPVSDTRTLFWHMTPLTAAVSAPLPITPLPFRPAQSRRRPDRPAKEMAPLLATIQGKICRWVVRLERPERGASCCNDGKRQYLHTADAASHIRALRTDMQRLISGLVMSVNYQCQYQFIASLLRQIHSGRGFSLSTVAT